MDKCKNCGNTLVKAMYNNKLINFCKACGYGLQDENELIIELTKCKFCNLWIFEKQEIICKCRQLTK